MDASLDILNNELCQVNTCDGRIARRQAIMGGFVTFPPPTPEASEDEDKDDNDVATTSDDVDDGDASSFGANEMST